MANGEFDPQKIDEFLGKITKSGDAFKTFGFIALLILGILILKSMVYSLQPEEVGVVQRFGKYLKTTGPGLHFKLPWGIDSVTKVKNQFVFKEEFGYATSRVGVRTEYQDRGGRFEDVSLMLTGDLNIADVEWIVQYQIVDPVKYLFNVRDPNATLRDASETAMRLIVGDRSVDEILTFGREEINGEVEIKLQELMDAYGTGMAIRTVQLQDVNPPESVKDSFDDVNRAKQERETVINQAREAYNKVIPQARGEADKVLRSAEGYQSKRVNEAKGDAERFLEVYKAYAQSPSVIKKRLYIEKMADVMKRLQNVWVVDEKLKNVVPLLQMMDTPPANKAAQ